MQSQESHVPASDAVAAQPETISTGLPPDAAAAFDASARIAELEAQLTEAKDQFLRARAEQENQRRPSVEELSARTGVDEDKISQSMMASGHHVSIDAPFGEDDDNSMADVMSSGDDSRTDKHVDHESMAQELKQVLNKCLKERERKIVCACFGIDETEKGLEEIGDKMGLTRERVRQIREKSITKLRESGKIGILMKYLG